MADQNQQGRRPLGALRQRVTYLEMTRPPMVVNRPAPFEGLAVSAPDPFRLDAYLALFRRVGALWLWWERLRLSEAEMVALFADPRVEVRYLTHRGSPLGISELDRRRAGEVEIAYLGLIADCLGRGIGAWFLQELLKAAWAPDTSRVWLHTCDHDHPGALAFYERAGFRPYRREEIVIPDPRLAGYLPIDAAPHIPLAGDEGADTAATGRENGRNG